MNIKARLNRIEERINPGDRFPPLYLVDIDSGEVSEQTSRGCRILAIPVYEKITKDYDARGKSYTAIINDIPRTSEMR